MKQDSLKNTQAANEREKEALSVQLANLGRDKESGKEQLMEELRRCGLTTIS